MNKIRITSLILASLIAAASLCSCNSQKSNDDLLDKKDPATVTIWHYYNGVQLINFDNAVSEFNETIGAEKGIIVEAFSKNSISELADAVVASVKKDVGAEEPPNIFATYSETAYTVDQLGKLVDIGQYFTDEEMAEYIPEYIDEGKLGADGSLKIFPTAKSTEVMILNTTDWSEFAAETGAAEEDLKTWEGLAETAEKYYNYTDAITPDTPNDGKAFFGRDSVANYMNIGAAQLGEEFVKADENNNAVLNINKDAVRKLWDNYYVPYVKGYYTAKGRYRSEDAKTGAIIALIGSTTSSAYYPTEVTIDDDYTYPIKNKVMPVPNFEGTDPYIVQQGAGMSIIKSDEKTEYASAVFLKWFTEEERNIEFTVNSGYLPVKKSAYDKDKIHNVIDNAEEGINDTLSRTIDLAVDEIDTYKPYVSIAFEHSSEIRDVLGDYIQNSAAGDYEAANERIEKGEDRDAVIAEYTSDDAFEKWFTDFSTSLENAAK